MMMMTKVIVGYEDTKKLRIGAKNCMSPWVFRNEFLKYSGDYHQGLVKKGS